MIQIYTQTLQPGDFFATEDPSPGNVFVLRVPVGKIDPGLCQRLADGAYWALEADYLVRKIPPDEYDQTHFPSPTERLFPPKRPLAEPTRREG